MVSIAHNLIKYDSIGINFSLTALLYKVRNNDTSTFRQRLQLAWPISLQSSLVTMLGMSDIMIVGHLGDAALASVGLRNRIQFVVLIILSGLAPHALLCLASDSGEMHLALRGR